MPDLLETYIENRWIVQPNHANTLGTAHGGTVLKWMDEAGVMSAMRFTGRDCATVRIDGVSFERPVEVGDTALVEAYAYETGETSVTVRLRAFSENPRTGEREPTTRSHAVFVAIDDDRRPVETPELTVSTERGQRLRDAARDDRTDEGLTAEPGREPRSDAVDRAVSVPTRPAVGRPVAGPPGGNRLSR